MRADVVNRTHLPPPPEPTPTVRCRACGAPMRVEWQPGLASTDGHWQATCDVQDAGDELPCLLAGYTMGVRGYPTINLTRHLVTGMARRERLAMANKGEG